MKLLVVVAVIFTLTPPPDTNQPVEPREGEAFFYANSDCSGDPALVVAPNSMVNNLKLRSVTGGMIACVLVGPDTKVQLFRNSDFSGAKLVLTRIADGPEARWVIDGRWQRFIRSAKVSKATP